jgi:TolA-binding protein
LEHLINVLLKEIRTETVQKPTPSTESQRETPTRIARGQAAESPPDAQLAATKLKFAKILASDGKTAKAKERLAEIIKKFPETEAAKEAKQLLKKL